jgi:hypothetical protein
MDLNGTPAVTTSTRSPLWTLYGPCMDPVWTLHGPPTHYTSYNFDTITCMDPACTLYGPCMDPVWTLHGPCMDPVWTLHGPPMDPLWTPIWTLHDHLFGPCMDPVWTPHAHNTSSNFDHDHLYTLHTHTHTHYIHTTLVSTSIWLPSAISYSESKVHVMLCCVRAHGSKTCTFTHAHYALAPRC